MTMKQRNFTKKDVMTDPILRKGHKHTDDRQPPRVCDVCGGFGENRLTNKICPKCEGLGEIYE